MPMNSMLMNALLFPPIRRQRQDWLSTRGERFRLPSRAPNREFRKQQLRHVVGFLQPRIARKHERVDTDVEVLLEAPRQRFGIADERGACSAANETDAGPQIRAD